MKRTSGLKAAKRYAKKGVSVIPVRPNDKKTARRVLRHRTGSAGTKS